MENDTSKIMKGAFLLTFAGVISKVLSASYRIPLQNLTGDFGFYIYQQVYPLLGMATVLALYGFPVAISKISSERQAENKPLSYKQFYGPISLIILSINLILFLFLFMNAEFIAMWVGDKNLTYTYQIAAVIFLVIPCTSVLRGAFQGMQKMTPTALSQVGEQVIRVGIIITGAYLIFNETLNIYQIGPIAGFAALAGSGIAILILVIFLTKHTLDRADETHIPWRNYLKTIILFGLVASFNHMILLIMQFADTISLVASLKGYGVSKQVAMEMKGIFDRGQPLIQIGAVLGSSFALVLVPNLTKDKLLNQVDALYKSIQHALTFSFYLSFGAMLGLFLIFPETNALLFKSVEGTISLRILSLSVLLSSVAITGATILQGIGYLKRTAIFILIAFFIKWIGNQVMVPELGIIGSSIATVVSLLILSGMVLYELKCKLPRLHLLHSSNSIAFLLASLGMIGYITIIKIIMPTLVNLSRGTLLIWVLIMIIGGALIYLVLLIRLKAFSKDELLMMPFANLLNRLSKED